MRLNKINNITSTIAPEIIESYFDNFSESEVICMAPFTGLHFNANGEVGACFNHKNTYYYGRYPEMKIKDILNSTPRKLHQKFIAANNFSLACKSCERNLNIKNYSGLLSTKYSQFKNEKNIKRIDFELSSRVDSDFNCCDAEKININSEIYNSHFLKDIKPFLKRIQFADFSGGEVFLTEIYYEIWDYIIKSNPDCIINIHTFGYILNDRIKELLKHPRVIVSITLDKSKEFKSIISQTEEKNDFVNNLNWFNQNLQSKGIVLQLTFCPTRDNWNEFAHIVEFANSNNCSLFFMHDDFSVSQSLKWCSMEKLIEIGTLYENIAKNCETSTLTAINNNRACELNEVNTTIIDFCKLIRTWETEAADYEKNTVVINKAYLRNLISKFRSESSYSILKLLVESAPDEWRIQTSRLFKLEQLDLNNIINNYKLQNLSDEQILEISKDYLGINRSENTEL